MYSSPVSSKILAAINTNNTNMLYQAEVAGAVWMQFFKILPSSKNHNGYYLNSKIHWRAFEDKSRQFQANIRLLNCMLRIFFSCIFCCAKSISLLRMLHLKLFRYG